MSIKHSGMILALLENNCLPKILSGSSAGSIYGSYVAVRSDDEIRNGLTPETLMDITVCASKPWIAAISLLQNGHIWDPDNHCCVHADAWIEWCQWENLAQHPADCHTDAVVFLAAVQVCIAGASRFAQAT